MNASQRRAAMAASAVTNPVFAIAASLALSSVAAAEDPAPGTRFEVRPDALAQPNATPSVSNPAAIVDRPLGAGLAVPPGFVATLFADLLEHPRNLTVLRDGNGDGRAEQRFAYAEGISRPFGLAQRPEGLYVADTDAVWRSDDATGDTKARTTLLRVTPAGALGASSGHWTRNLVFAPDGERFYVAIGSAGNVSEESEPRATIRELRRDGSGGRSWATGLRIPSASPSIRAPDSFSPSSTNATGWATIWCPTISPR